MKTSASGRAAIEGREGRRLSAYRDTRGIWTIGIGHAATGLPPRPHAGMTITEAECDALLAADLAPVEAVINAAVNVPLGQNEFDALASLGFNIGIGGLRGSTVIKKLNAGDAQGAAVAFMNWCKPAVLTGRRDKEREQFLTPDPPNDAGVSRSHAVVKARSAAVADKAARMKGKAKVAASGGTAIALAGVAATAASASTAHHHIAWIVGAVVAVGAAVDLAMTLIQRRSAAVLSANAVAQAATAASLAKSVAAAVPAEPAKS